MGQALGEDVCLREGLQCDCADVVQCLVGAQQLAYGEGGLQGEVGQGQSQDRIGRSCGGGIQGEFRVTPCVTRQVAAVNFNVMAQRKTISDKTSGAPKCLGDSPLHISRKLFKSAQRGVLTLPGSRIHIEELDIATEDSETQHETKPGGN